MNKCKQCGVPLEGILSIVPRVLFAVKPSEDNPERCNKCADKESQKRYQCHLCGRMIHENRSLEHIKAEEYFIKLIKNDHSYWGSRQPTEEEATVYYRELIQKTEI